MTNANGKFDELVFFAKVKKRPGLFLGTTSLLHLTHQLLGMEYAFSFYNSESPMKYFDSFVDWYHQEILDSRNGLNGYECWWNHILYTSGNNDVYAFKSFFIDFERYLLEVHNVCLPEVP